MQSKWLLSSCWLAALVLGNKVNFAITCVLLMVKYTCCMCGKAKKMELFCII